MSISPVSTASAGNVMFGARPTRLTEPQAREILSAKGFEEILSDERATLYKKGDEGDTVFLSVGRAKKDGTIPRGSAYDVTLAAKGILKGNKAGQLDYRA